MLNTNKAIAATTGALANAASNPKATPTKKSSMMNGSANPAGAMIEPQKMARGITGKAPAPPPKDGVSTANERVQNYINNLETHNVDGTSSLG